MLVVGGGIGGVATALACARRNISARVLERAPAIAEVGAGLQVGPNAWRALERLGVSGSLDRRAVLPRRAAMLDIYTGREITFLDLGPGFIERFGAPYAVMHRGDLLTALLDGCVAGGRVALETGKEVTDVVEGDEDVEVRCADGTAYRADVVIGADGLNSTVRRIILDDRPPQVAQYVVYRGTGPRPAGVEDAVMLWVGDAMHYMQYPVRGGTVVNQVASFKSALGGAPDSPDWGTPTELEERFADACEWVRAAITRLDTSRRWALYDRPPLAGWAQGRIALLGDAAHPMQQYLAQGACQALEDALALADALAGTPADLPGALRRYEEARFPRTSAVQQLTRYMGAFCHLGGVARSVRNQFLSDRDPADYRFVDWLYRELGSDGEHAPPRLPEHHGLYGPEPAMELR